MFWSSRIISQRYGSGSESGSFPFLIKVLTQNFSKKYKFLRLKMMCLCVSYKKKYFNKLFFASFMSLKKRVGSGSMSQRQCCGSGSAGSTCFGASWIRIRIHKSEVWIRILLSLSKYSKKNLDFYCFVTSFNFLALKNYVKVPSKSNMQETFFLILFFVAILKVSDENRRIRTHQSEARIRIRTKMSWIRNTGQRCGSGSAPECHGSSTLVFS